MDNRITLIKQIINQTRQSLLEAESLLTQLSQDEGGLDATDFHFSATASSEDNDYGASAGRIIEGVFDGTHMIGPDGHRYAVPVNYASKSKLVEGDILKLTIRPDGGFIFKPIKPIEKRRLLGVLVKDDDTGDFRALVDNRLYKILLASITYYKGRIGDSVVLLVPATSPSSWAAVENIVPQGTSLDEGVLAENLGF